MNIIGSNLPDNTLNIVENESDQGTKTLNQFARVRRINTKRLSGAVARSMNSPWDGALHPVLRQPRTTWLPTWWVWGRHCMLRSPPLLLPARPTGWSLPWMRMIWDGDDCIGSRDMRRVGVRVTAPTTRTPPIHLHIQDRIRTPDQQQDLRHSVLRKMVKKR